MLRLEEILIEAQSVADHRNKVFNDLIDRFQNEFVPFYAKVCLELGYEGFMIWTSEKPFSSTKTQGLDQEYFVHFDCENGKFYNMLYNAGYKNEVYDMVVSPPLKSGIVSLIEAMLDRLNQLLLLAKRGIKNATYRQNILMRGIHDVLKEFNTDNFTGFTEKKLI